jgi:hypothetical protein
MQLLRKALAEVVGTFVLVVVGCGVAIVTSADVVATPAQEIWIFIFAPLWPPFCGSSSIENPKSKPPRSSNGSKKSHPAGGFSFVQ